MEQKVTINRVIYVFSEKKNCVKLQSVWGTSSVSLKKTDFKWVLQCVK